jgi:hypothetical protein
VQVGFLHKNSCECKMASRHGVGPSGKRPPQPFTGRERAHIHTRPASFSWQIETLVTFCGMVWLAGDGLRSVGRLIPHPRASALSCPSSAIYGSGFTAPASSVTGREPTFYLPRPALCYEDSSSCCRSRRHFSRNLLALANAATPRRCVVVGPRHNASALLRSAGSVIVGTEACDGEARCATLSKTSSSSAAHGQ